MLPKHYLHCIEDVPISGLIPAEHLLFSAPAPGFRYMETDDSRGGISMLFIPGKRMRAAPREKTCKYGRERGDLRNTRVTL